MILNARAMRQTHTGKRLLISGVEETLSDVTCTERCQTIDLLKYFPVTTNRFSGDLSLFVMFIENSVLAKSMEIEQYCLTCVQPNAGEAATAISS